MFVPIDQALVLRWNNRVMLQFSYREGLTRQLLVFLESFRSTWTVKMRDVTLLPPNKGRIITFLKFLSTVIYTFFASSAYFSFAI